MIVSYIKIILAQNYVSSDSDYEVFEEPNSKKKDKSKDDEDEFKPVHITSINLKK